MQCVPIFSEWSRLMTYAPFFNLRKLFLEKTLLNGINFF